jgi:AcrR family transcriptional regulator
MDELTAPELRILDAARKVFEREGFAGSRMQHIADEAGISKASLHYYFRSKEKLFERIFDEYLKQVIPIFSTWVDDGDDWPAKVRTFMREWMRVFSTTPLMMIVSEFSRDPSRLEEYWSTKRKRPNAFVTYYERLRKDGLVRDTDPKVFALAMHALCAYPYMNKAMMCGALRLKTAEYEAFLNTYTDQAAEIVIRSMKK